MGDMQIVAVASKKVEPQYVEMMVPLYSYGCERKVKKTLSHLKGIYSVTVEYEQQKVTVWGICNKHDVLSTMRSKRKEARFWKPEDNVEMHEDEAEPSPPSVTRKDFKFNKPSLALMKARSLSWKAWRKVFTRSYSF
ncbi:heavy metal-associated isoprenylated plant protein 28 [Hibiscus syriacus]|uniref:heavy metal-associated isoprenylated plant protein 28 n=1 Tax=Hibiscus syriacus TaxID=106335 RepID=UPI001923CBB4|nr:heavy metal-associated isoprenylated plant protein 28 [Hibiscus syriacus]